MKKNILDKHKGTGQPAKTSPPSYLKQMLSIFYMSLSLTIK